MGLAVSLAVVTGPASAQGVEPPAKGQSVTIDRIRASGTLRAGAATALPWLGQNPATHEFFGPSVEMGKDLADRLGVKLALIPSGYDTIIAGLQANQFDITIAALSATEKRKQVVDFVNYTIAGTCYAVLADNAKVNSLEDLNQPSVSIGTWTGTGTEQVVKEKYTKATLNSVVMPVPGSNRMQEVLAKRIDAATLDSPRALLVVHQFPQLKIVPGRPGQLHCASRSAGADRHRHHQRRSGVRNLAPGGCGADARQDRRGDHEIQCAGVHAGEIAGQAGTAAQGCGSDHSAAPALATTACPP
ncbi:MAG: transporter substrate-binding domain-containing protein [Acetobacteraceae bacterium]